MNMYHVTINLSFVFATHCDFLMVFDYPQSLLQWYLFLVLVLIQENVLINSEMIIHSSIIKALTFHQFYWKLGRPHFNFGVFETYYKSNL